MGQIAQGDTGRVVVAAWVSTTDRDRLHELARKEERSLSWILRRALRREIERDDEGGDAA